MIGASLWGLVSDGGGGVNVLRLFRAIRVLKLVPSRPAAVSPKMCCNHTLFALSVRPSVSVRLSHGRSAC